MGEEDFVVSRLFVISDGGGGALLSYIFKFGGKRDEEVFVSCFVADYSKQTPSSFF